jgi:hypothetical protein
MLTSAHQARNWIGSLRQFLGPQFPGSHQGAAERCELCHSEIEGRHPHLLEPQSRRLLCACPACALLFAGGAASRYRRVPSQVTRLQDFRLADAQWEALLIPINMAFFFRSSQRARVLAMYPGPGGAAESTLDLDAWDDLAETNPQLRELEEDVEALLVNRVAHAREYYRVPIDRCYELVGRIRTHWHGMSGGEGAREAIAAFFADLREETDRPGPVRPFHA